MVNTIECERYRKTLGEGIDLLRTVVKNNTRFLLFGLAIGGGLCGGTYMLGNDNAANYKSHEARHEVRDKDIQESLYQIIKTLDDLHPRKAKVGAEGESIVVLKKASP